MLKELQDTPQADWNRKMAREHNERERTPDQRMMCDPKEAKPLRKPRAHPERDLEKSCGDLLQYDGWRQFKMEWNFSEKKRVSVGESGMPDRLYIRYLNPGIDVLSPDRSMCGVLWIEWKAKKGKASTEQRLWHAAERKRGALVWLAGADFPASIEGFLAHYRGSGLMRRRL